MAKISFILLITLVTLMTESLALKCHYCEQACEASKASEKICGTTIGPSQEALCIAETQKDKDTSMAVRKCVIVSKNQDYTCPTGYDCKSCKTDLCNAATSIGHFSVILSIVTAFVATKIL